MAVCKTKIISEQELKDLTDISQNVDDSKFTPAIRIAQDIHIRHVVGKTCFDEIVSQVENDNLTAINKTLLDDFIKPALAWWTLYEAYPNLHSYISSTGVQSKSTEQAQSVDSRTLSMLRNTAKSRAEYYTDKLICELCDNIDNYDCYSDDDDCCIDITTDRFSASGIVLPKSPKKSKRYK